MSAADLPAPDAPAETVAEKVRAHPRPDQFPWGRLVQQRGYPFVVTVIERLSPEAVPLLPKTLAGMERPEEDGRYRLPDLHSDVLWIYGQFLAMYRRGPKAHAFALDWFRTALKPAQEAHAYAFEGAATSGA